MLIPASILTFAMFPGLFVYIIVCKFFCCWAKLSVYEECYFRIGNPAAYITYEEPQSVKSALLLTFGPFIVSTLLCSLITFPTYFGSVIADAGELDIVLMWVGISLGLLALPKSHQLEQLKYLITEDGKRYWLSHFLTVAFKIFKFLEYFGLSLIYTAIIITLPSTILM